MQIVVLANDIQAEEILSKKKNKETDIKFVKDFSELTKYKVADALFILDHAAGIDNLKIFDAKPVIINAVEFTLQELFLLQNFSRINGWPGFLKRTKWEIATQNENVIQNIFTQLNWEYTFVKDEPGLVSARILSMIINEAYFALGDNISTKDEINIAMRLGTNYPYGPFEWCEKIGLHNVYHLLKKLSIGNKRYSVAPVMEAEYALLQP